MATMRLDRYIAENTPYSRAEVKRLIGSGRVAVDSEINRNAKLKINITQHTISLDDKKVTPLGELYLLLNKPGGYLSATADSVQPTLIDLIRDERNFLGDPADLAYVQRASLQIVGRLDKDTTGLILLTTDGDWNHRLSSPNSGCAKTYEAALAEPINISVVSEFAKGIMLRGETKATKPAELEIITPHLARLTISEGRYHQVKRMFAAMGNKVTELKRIQIGSIALDNTLQPGQFRLLTDEELLTLPKKEKAKVAK